MSGFSSPQPFSNEYHDLSSSFPPSLNDKQFLHPIDEADDFYDPFSDLSLFLSKKIKNEIQEIGTPKKWSGKIEANLLSKILPDFKRQFPRYRLGTTALKKVWEKVGYYYEKIQLHKGAMGANGRLNLPLMIRENLKNSQEPSGPLNLPPYHFAHQIAVKISECIATLEGRRPDLDHLAKMIWSIQKNRLRNLSAMHAKSPYEEYDKLDKLIVKAHLEACAESPNISLKALKKNILDTLHVYGSIIPLMHEGKLTASLSMLLAEKLYPTSIIACKLAIEERKKLEAFIDSQIQLSSGHETLSLEPYATELAQRVLSLYPIAQELPKDLSEEALKYAIHAVQNDSHSTIDGALFVFINAEMHLISEEKRIHDFEKMEKIIIEVYRQAVALPLLDASSSEAYELLVWKKLDEHKKCLSKLSENAKSVLEKELANLLFDRPQQSFGSIVQGAIQFFKKAGQLPFHEKQNSSFWEKVKKKTEIWALQNEMLCRWVHFDERAPLFTLYKETKKSAYPQGQALAEFLNKTLRTFPHLAPFEKELKVRFWILENYFWYNKLSDGAESSYDRFLKVQRHYLQNKEPSLSKAELEEKLFQISLQMLPLTPFQEEALSV